MYLKATVTDNDGLVNIDEVFFSVDNKPPVTNYDYDGKWHNTDFTIVLAGEDKPGCGLKDIYYKINDGEKKSVSANGYPSINKEGEHNKLEYWGVDIIPNEETPHFLYDIKLDKTPPITKIYKFAREGKNGWYVEKVQVRLDATDNLSGVDYTKYRIDNGNWMDYSSAFTISSEGTHTIEYYSKDKAQIIETVKPETLKIDTNPPVTNISLSGTKGENDWYVTKVEIELKVVESVSETEVTRYKLDNGQWKNYSAKIIVEEGEHIVYYHSEDRAGHVENDRKMDIKVDTIAPTAKLIIDGNKGENNWYISDVKLDVDSSDDGSKVKSESIRIGSGSWQNPPVTIKTEGEHTVEFYSRDFAGNQKAITESVKVDKSSPPAPKVTSSTHPEGKWSNIRAPVFSWTEPSDTSKITGYSYEFDRDSRTIPDETIDGTAVSISYKDIDDGDNIYFHIRAKDKAGWWGSTAHYGPVMIDTLPPVSNIVFSGVKGEDDWFISPVQVTITAEDENSMVNYTKYRIGKGSWNTYSSKFTIDTNGSHIVEYCSVDNAGNPEATKPASIKIDTYPPVTNISLSGKKGDNDWYTTGVEVTLASDDSTSRIKLTRYRIDGGGWRDYASKFIIDSDGQHTIEYYSVDNAGNSETKKSESLKLDTQKPVTNISLPTPNGENNWHIFPVEINLSATDATSEIALTEYQINGKNWQTYSAPFRISEDGIHTIEYRSKDEAGNQEDTKTYEIRIDLYPPPAPTISSSTHPWADKWSNVNSPEFSWAELSDTSGIYGYSHILDGKAATIPDEISEGPSTSTKYANISDGQSYFHIRARDNSGRWGAAAHYRVMIDTKGPELSEWSHEPDILTVETKGSLRIKVKIIDVHSGVMDFPQLFYRIGNGSYKTPKNMYERIGDIYYSDIREDWSALSGEKVHYKVKAFDRVGNFTEKEDSTAIGTPPEINLVTNFSGWIKGQKLLEVNVKDDNLEKVIYYYSLDGADWKPISETNIPPYQVSWDTTSIICDESVWLKTVAKDTTDLMSQDISEVFSVDNQAPATRHDYDGRWHKPPFIINLVGDDGKGIGVEKTLYKLDGGGEQSGTSVELSTEGTHNLIYWSIDKIGNTESAQPLNDIKIDATPPETTISISGTPGNDSWYRSPVIITLSSKDLLSGVNVTKYQLNNGGLQDYSKPFTVDAEGINNIKFYSIDRAVNVESKEPVSFKIDTQPPTASIIKRGTMGLNGWYISDVTIECNSSDTTSKVKECLIKMADGTWQGSSVIIRGEGRYSVSYYAIDNAGNKCEQSEEIAIDKSTPEFSNWTHIPEILTVETQGDYIIQVAIIDTSSDVSQSRPPQLAYRILGDYNEYQDMIPDGKGNWSFKIHEDWQNLGGETLKYKVRAFDSAGNSVESNEISDLIRLPGIIVSPGSIDFGTVWVNEVIERRLTITNTGSAELRVKSITTDAGSVRVSKTSFTIRPGMSDYITVSFSPTSVYIFSGSLTIESNALKSPKIIVQLYAKFWPPEITTVEPQSGDVRGDEVIIISGSHFTEGTKVEIGNGLVEEKVIFPTQIILKTPPGIFGEKVDVIVTNPDQQQARLEEGFKYKKPSAITLETSNNSIAWDSNLTISGRVFDPDDSNVIFKNVEVTITFASSNKSGLLNPVRLQTDFTGSYRTTFSFSHENIDLWEVKASWPGNVDYEDAVSEKKEFKITRVSTAIVWDAGNPKNLTIVDKSYVYISGSIQPNPGIGKVKLSVVHPDGISEPEKEQTRDLGMFTFNQPIDKVGQWRFVSLWDGDDRYYGAASDEYLLTVVANQPPKVNVSSIPGAQTGKVPITYILTDRENDNISLECDYSKDGGKTWASATVEGATKGIQNYTGKIIWDSRQDIPSTGGTDVQFRIIPRDYMEGEPGITNIFSLVNLLGDYDDDRKVGPSDLDIFIKAWDRNDAEKDIGPATGKVPGLIPKFDGKLDFEDLVVLIMMWNWSAGAKPFTAPFVVTNINMPTLLSFEISPGIIGTNEHHVNINLDKGTIDEYLDTISSARFLFMFDPEKAGVLKASHGNLWSSEGAYVIFLPRVDNQQGIMEIYAAKLSADRTANKELHKAFPVTPTLVSLEFDCFASEDVGIQMSYELRDAEGRVISSGQSMIKLSFYEPPPKRTELLRNYPNPSNPETWIPYQLAHDGYVSILIYNTTGQLVRILELGDKKAGWYIDKDKAAYWDGKDRFGENAASGVYFYVFNAGSYTAVRKLAVVR